MAARLPISYTPSTIGSTLKVRFAATCKGQLSTRIDQRAWRAAHSEALLQHRHASCGSVQRRQELHQAVRSRGLKHLVHAGEPLWAHELRHCLNDLCAADRFPRVQRERLGEREPAGGKPAATSDAKTLRAHFAADMLATPVGVKCTLLTTLHALGAT
jgi:hypothetical protein